MEISLSHFWNWDNEKLHWLYFSHLLSWVVSIFKDSNKLSFSDSILMLCWKFYYLLVYKEIKSIPFLFLFFFFFPQMKSIVFCGMFCMVHIEILVFGICGDERCRCICSHIFLFFYYRRLQEDIYSHKLHLKVMYIGFINKFILASLSLHGFILFYFFKTDYKLTSIFKILGYLELCEYWCIGDIQSWFCDMMSNCFINHLIDI